MRLRPAARIARRPTPQPIRALPVILRTVAYSLQARAFGESELFQYTSAVTAPPANSKALPRSDEPVGDWYVRMATGSSDRAAVPTGTSSATDSCIQRAVPSNLTRSIFSGITFASSQVRVL